MDKAQAAKRIRALRAEIKSHEIEVKDLISTHFSSLHEGESENAGRYIVKATPNVRFDPALARKVLTEEEFESILETAPSSKKAKELLAPVRYSMLQRHYDAVVKVVDPEEEEN